MSLCRKNSTRGKVIDKKQFIRIGCLWSLQAGREGIPCPKNSVGYSFIIKGKLGREGTLCFLGRHHASIISSSSMLGKGVFLSLGGQARSTNYYFFYVCREHVLGIINLLSSPGGIWVSCHHWFVIWGHVSCIYCMALLLSKPAWFCG